MSATLAKNCGIMIAMATESFTVWINKEIKERGWSLRELARRSNLSSTAVINVMNQHRRPGTDFCKGVARAFRISPDEVMRRAGILPPSPPKTIRLSEALRLFNSLTESEQESMLIQMKALADEEARRREQERERERVARLKPAAAGTGAM